MLKHGRILHRSMVLDRPPIKRMAAEGIITSLILAEMIERKLIIRTSKSKKQNF